MRNKDITPTEERKEQENENNEILLAEDAVQTTAYCPLPAKIDRKKVKKTE